MATKTLDYSTVLVSYTVAQDGTLLASANVINNEDGSIIKQAPMRILPGGLRDVDQPTLDAMTALVQSLYAEAETDGASLSGDVSTALSTKIADEKAAAVLELGGGAELPKP